MSLHNRLVLQSVASLFVAINLLLGACSISADINANSFLTDDISVAQDAASCRRSLASNIEYEPIARRMPLVDIYQATIRQMADAQLANPEEVSALLAWTQELQKCRQKTLAAIRLQSPIALGCVLTGWNAEDGVFVLLSKRRLTRGDAVTRLRTIRAELFSKLTDQAFRESTQLNANKQADSIVPDIDATGRPDEREAAGADPPGLLADFAISGSPDREPHRSHPHVHAN